MRDQRVRRLSAATLPAGQGTLENQISAAASSARSPQALERRVAALKGSGFDIGWVDGDMG